MPSLLDVITAAAADKSGPDGVVDTAAHDTKAVQPAVESFPVLVAATEAGPAVTPELVLAEPLAVDPVVVVPVVAELEVVHPAVMDSEAVDPVVVELEVMDGNEVDSLLMQPAVTSGLAVAVKPVFSGPALAAQEIPSAVKHAAAEPVKPVKPEDAARVFNRRVCSLMRGTNWPRDQAARKSAVLAEIVQSRTGSSHQHTKMHMPGTACTFDSGAVVSSSPAMGPDVWSQRTVERGTLKLTTGTDVHVRSLVVRKVVTTRISEPMRGLLEEAAQGYPSAWVPLMLHFPADLFRELDCYEAQRSRLVEEHGEAAAARMLKAILGWHIECLPGQPDHVRLAVYLPWTHGGIPEGHPLDGEVGSRNC